MGDQMGRPQSAGLTLNAGLLVRRAPEADMRTNAGTWGPPSFPPVSEAWGWALGQPSPWPEVFVPT